MGAPVDWPWYHHLKSETKPHDSTTGGLVPDLFTYNSSITSCEKALQWQLALELFVCLLKEQRLKVTWIKTKHRFSVEIFGTEFFGTHLEDPGIPSWKLSYPYISHFRGTFESMMIFLFPRWDMYPFPGGETLGVFYHHPIVSQRFVEFAKKKSIQIEPLSTIEWSGTKIFPIWIARGCILNTLCT